MINDEMVEEHPNSSIAFGGQSKYMNFTDDVNSKQFDCQDTHLCMSFLDFEQNTTAFFPQFSYAPISVGVTECRNDTSSIFFGDLLIFCSQVIVASQMVIEEKFITKYNVPALQAVGWEGTFGFTTLSLLLIPFSFLYVGPSFGHGPRHVLEDAYDGVYQLYHNPLLLLAYLGEIFAMICDS